MSERAHLQQRSPAAPGLARLLANLHGLAPPGTIGEPDTETLCADAFADGQRDGRAEAEAALEPMRAALAAAAAALAAATQIDNDALRPVFTAAVGRVCAAVLMAELRLEPGALRPLVDAALAAAGAKAARLRVHPDALAAFDAGALAIEVVADAALARDAVAVDGPAFALETSLTARLAAVVAALA